MKIDDRHIYMAAPTMLTEGGLDSRQKQEQTKNEDEKYE